MTKNLLEVLGAVQCVSIERKVYTAEEVGEELALQGVVSYLLCLEHQTEPGFIGGVVEIVAEEILDYEVPMWDGRTLTQHVVQITQAMS